VTVTFNPRAANPYVQLSARPRLLDLPEAALVRLFPELPYGAADGLT
jgi:hypothetical protein